MRTAQHKSGMRRAVLAAALLAGVAAIPAHADAVVGTAQFDGGTVALTRADLPADWLNDATWVGQANGFVLADTVLDCVDDIALDVYTSPRTNSLVFANVAGTADCLQDELQAIINPTVGGDLAPCVTALCVNQQVAFRQGMAVKAAQFLADGATGNVDGADETATGTAATTLSLSVASALAGEVVAQYALLSELSGVYFAAEPTSLDVNANLLVNGQNIMISPNARMEPTTAVGCLSSAVECAGVTVQNSSRTASATSSAQSPHIDPHRFEYCNGLTPVWEDKNSDEGVYGNVIYNMWCLPERVSNENDFYATSQDASVTSEDESRLTKIWSTWESNSNGIRMVDASPRTMVSEGQGETITYNANLSGNVSAKKDGTGGDIGASFGLGRSYTRPNHNHGGGAYGNQGHYVKWETADNGSSQGKQAAGVETWVIPVGSSVGFIWNAHAWWCNDPCGP